MSPLSKDRLTSQQLRPAAGSPPSGRRRPRLCGIYPVAIPTAQSWQARAFSQTRVGSACRRRAPLRCAMPAMTHDLRDISTRLLGTIRASYLCDRRRMRRRPSARRTLGARRATTTYRPGVEPSCGATWSEIETSPWRSTPTAGVSFAYGKATLSPALPRLQMSLRPRSAHRESPVGSGAPAA